MKTGDELVHLPALGDELPSLITSRIRAGKSRIDAFKSFARSERKWTTSGRSLQCSFKQIDSAPASAKPCDRTPTRRANQRRQRAEEATQKVGVKARLSACALLLPAPVRRGARSGYYPVRARLRDGVAWEAENMNNVVLISALIVDLAFCTCFGAERDSTRKTESGDGLGQDAGRRGIIGPHHDVSIGWPSFVLRFCCRASRCAAAPAGHRCGRPGPSHRYFDLRKYA